MLAERGDVMEIQTTLTTGSASAEALRMLQEARDRALREVEPIERAIAALTHAEALKPLVGRARAKMPPSIVAEAVLKGVGHPLTVASLRELMGKQGYQVGYRALYNALAKKPRTFARGAAHTWRLL